MVFCRRVGGELDENYFASLQANLLIVYSGFREGRGGDGGDGGGGVGGGGGGGAGMLHGRN